MRVSVVALDAGAREISLAALARRQDVRLAQADAGEDFRDCDVAILAGMDISLAIERAARLDLLSALVRFVRRGGCAVGVGAGYPLLGTRIVLEDGRKIPALKVVNFTAELALPARRVTGHARGAVAPFCGSVASRRLAFGAVTLRPPARPWFFLKTPGAHEVSEGVVSGDGRVLATSFLDLFEDDAFCHALSEHVRVSRGHEQKA